MKISIFGGTGVTGLCAVHAAVRKGYAVSVLVRDPHSEPAQEIAKLPEVTVVPGDVCDPIPVREALQGCDACVIVLGTRNGLAPTTVLSTGTKNILSAMQELGIERVSLCLSAFLLYEIDRVPERMRPITEDHIRMYEAARASQANYVAVMPPHIRPDAEESTIDSPTQIVVNPKSSPGRAISKWQLGAFLIDCLTETEKYTRCSIGIADAAPPTS